MFNIKYSSIASFLFLIVMFGIISGCDDNSSTIVDTRQLSIRKFEGTNSVKAKVNKKFSYITSINYGPATKVNIKNSEFFKENYHGWMNAKLNNKGQKLEISGIPDTLGTFHFDIKMISDSTLPNKDGIYYGAIEITVKDN